LTLIAWHPRGFGAEVTTLWPFINCVHLTHRKSCSTDAQRIFSRMEEVDEYPKGRANPGSPGKMAAKRK